MTDPHDRDPIDQGTLDAWRATYGLDKRTPRDAAQWWSDSLRGLAPAGAVAALGVALDDLDALRTALQEADTIMCHDDEATEWRDKWAHLWGPA